MQERHGNVSFILLFLKVRA